MSAFKSFEEVYQSSYSHGLEQIYKLENIDIKSVRKIEVRAESVKEARVEEAADLDLGDGHRLWITPQVFEEPIEVLELHKQPEKILKEQGIVDLKGLYEADLSGFVYTKGMGQGHIVELQGKLNRYLAGKPLTRQYEIDFESWIKAILAPLTRKESLLLMEAHGLEHSLVLTPMDVMEVRKMSGEEKAACAREAAGKIEKHKVIKRFREIESAFIRPWVLGRLGIASREEVEARLAVKSREPDLSRWRFVTALVPELEIGELYFATPYMEADYLILQKAIESFFWNDTAIYPIEELFRLVLEKLSLSFRVVDEEKLLKFLEASPRFSLVNESGNLLVSVC